MKGRHHRIELFGNRAHSGRADRPSEDRQQRLADFAHRKPQHKARQDHAVDLLGTPRIGTHHPNRRKPPGTRHRQLDVAKFGQQMASIRAIAPVGLVERGHLIEMTVDRLRHLALQDRRDRLPAETPVALAPFQPLRLHRLHELKCSR